MMMDGECLPIGRSVMSTRSTIRSRGFRSEFHKDQETSKVSS